MTRDWRAWAPDATAALLVLALGLWEVSGDDVYTTVWGSILVVGGLALAVGFSRALPALSLLLVWVVGGLQVLTGTGALVVEVLFALVAFGCARWGSTLVVWLSGLSIPAGATIAALWLDPNVFYDALRVAGVRMLAESAYRPGTDWRLPAALMAMAVLAAPWLAGLALRFGSRAQSSRASQLAAEQDAARAHIESEQAREIARLREEQARLARDVHDVVGHSLAVILAQAESAQFLPDADTGALRTTMANIATSARSSLQDVRHVLTETSEPAARRGESLDELIEGVRASGHEVVSSEVGPPQPLPPELDVVAYRVLQEMLTNAIRHGRRDRPVVVERHWQGELRIEVRNVVAEPEPGTAGPPDEPGQGLEGMRRRLEAAGGRLDVRRREEAEGPTFTATAWVPVRSVLP
jgi:signal transduction histidine kinase